VLSGTSAEATQVKTLRLRPALLQELDWRPSRWVSGASTASTDPVDEIRFSFVDDQLFNIAIDYAPVRTAGMTDADVIESISATYGKPVPPAVGAAVKLPAGPASDAGTIIAKWGDDDHTIVAYCTSSYGDSLRLIVSKPALAELARAAAAQALKLDVLEAPQKEIARQTKEREDERAAAEKARAVNKPVFQP
jgi:hypothetical protein